MIRGQVLLIHNAEFDVKFLNMELERCGKGHIEDYAAVIDTMTLYQPNTQPDADARQLRAHVRAQSHRPHLPRRSS